MTVNNTIHTTEVASNKQLNVNLIVRGYKAKYGLSRYTQTICDALAQEGISFDINATHIPWLIRRSRNLMTRLGYDIETFFTTYPLATPLKENAINHLTAQQMATLLYQNRKRAPIVITVHDIIPYLVRNDPAQSTFRHPFDYIFDSAAMKGLKRADRIIAISSHTKKTLIETLSLPEEKIRVVLYGVDHEVFRPRPVTEQFRTRYDLPEDARYLVYIGAESPRKNLPRLIEAFALVRSRFPETRLIKVGTPEYLLQFRQIEQLIAELNLQEFVHFVNHPPEEDLVRFYNLADVFVFPSLYEGFGLPPLEAMACGAPVVTSNATSLPEVVGEAALMVDPYSVDELANAICTILADSKLAEMLRQKSIQRAAQFTWERTADETVAVYREVHELSRC